MKCYLIRVARLLIALVLLTGCVEVPARHPAPTMVAVQRATMTPVLAQPFRWWLREPRVFERGGGWTLPVVIDLGGTPPPDEPVTYRFEANMLVAYEPVSDGSSSPAVVRAVPVEGRYARTVEQQVCYQISPTSNGRYRVEVRLERSAGFAPGDYRITLRSADGATLGLPNTITLH